jgi:hypothetical protein
VNAPVDELPDEGSDPEARTAKLLFTVTARTALWGGVLTRLDGDDGQPLYVVTRWSLTRSFSSLGEVKDFLDQVGAR